MTTIIETERLVLRPLRPDDLDWLTAALNNFNISQNTARIPFPYVRKNAEDFLAITQKLAPGTLRLSITRKDGEDRVCGGIGYENGEKVELGYWLAEAEWGKGYGGEAALAVTDHAFEVAGHERLAASYRIGNEASRRILERLGFKFVQEKLEFSKSVGAEVPVMHVEITRAQWLDAKGRRR
jgi:RimJ/RimL family protein N-acetyltransferase